MLRTPEAKNWVIYLSWLVVLFVYIILRIEIIDIPLDRDEGIFGYAGQVIL